jgi:DNA excision repair protein ERCC-3
MDESDFLGDRTNADLGVDYSGISDTRAWDDVGSGRAISGMIVLSYGAGKTIVGIAAMCTVQKSVILCCNESVSVGQWVDESVP